MNLPLTDSSIPVIAEYWPYGLRRAGALDRFHALVNKHTRRLLDLRVIMQDGAIADMAPVDTEVLSSRYHPDRQGQYTDLVY